MGDLRRIEDALRKGNEVNIIPNLETSRSKFGRVQVGAVVRTELEEDLLIDQGTFNILFDRILYHSQFEETISPEYQQLKEAIDKGEISSIKLQPSLSSV